MILHWSPRSPFVLKVRMVLHEYGLLEGIEWIRSVVPTDDPDHPIFEVNPLGQIPTLLTDDGKVISDSYVICEYLDTLRAPEIPSLFPARQGERLDMLMRHALADGLMDTLVRWVSEKHRPPEFRMQLHLDRCATKLDKVLAYWERQVEGWSGRPFDLGDMATAAAIKYIDFRFMNETERERLYPRLGEWFDGISQRESIRQTPLTEG